MSARETKEDELPEHVVPEPHAELEVLPAVPPPGWALTASAPASKAASAKVGIYVGALAVAPGLASVGFLTLHTQLA